MTQATFDSLASGYDDVAGSALGTVLRDRVRSCLTPLLNPDLVVMDLGCGTGIDAAWLAPQVRQLFAIDPSTEMVKQTAQRCSGLTNVVVARGDGRELAKPTGRPIDLLLANFGVVNCVGDLADFGDRLADVVKPGGHAVLVTMARWCPIELAVGVVTRNGDLLNRRRNHPKGAGSARDRTYENLDVQYASASDLADAFDGRLSMLHAESLGLVLPPFEQRRWMEGRASALRMASMLDERLGSVGARFGLGDHHIAVFQRVP